MDWIVTNDRIKEKAKQNFTNTDYALKLYNKFNKNQIDLREPRFRDYYQPSIQQRQGEMIYLWAGALAIGLAASHFL